MILVIDLELTCENPRSEDFNAEIIEIGAAWTSLDCVVHDRFEAFVYTPSKLSEYCTGLTGIKQSDVDSAITLSEAMSALAEFAQLHMFRVWGSWGQSDLNEINRNCANSGLSSPLDGWEHRNLMVEFAKGRGVKKRVGLQKALRIATVELEGAHHRALSDVINTIKLLHICQKGYQASNDVL
jgi:inhibitor of KinA sporulation pathway (predicted exonuclease)